MKKICLTTLMLCIAVTTTQCQSPAGKQHVEKKKGDRVILVYGNGMERAYIKYVANLTGKPNPRICFFPTAAAEDPRVITYWNRMVEGLAINPCVILTFISSSPDQKTFAEEILNSDAIIVGGGNTLNMIAIWHAQGIDTLLRIAYEKGTVLAGGSAGSLCWFTGGYSDSRPKELSLIDCMGFLDYSHCPHYNEPERKALYCGAILSGELKPGYACENGAALLFINGEMSKSLSLDPGSHNFYVSVVNGKVTEKILPAQIID
jgi:dipeptidase E